MAKEQLNGKTPELLTVTHGTRIGQTGRYASDKCLHPRETPVLLVSLMRQALFFQQNPEHRVDIRVVFFDLHDDGLVHLFENDVGPIHVG
jgi:hypothetical protein